MPVFSSLRRRARRLIAAAVLLTVPLLFSGCRDGYDADSLCEHLAKNECRFLYRCCGAIERDTMAGFTGAPAGPHHDEASCVEVYTRGYCQGFAPVREAVAEGRAEWDSENARRCYGYVEDAARTCDPSRYLLGDRDAGDGCGIDDLLIGRVSVGGDCFFALECAAEDAACVPKTSEDPERDLITASGTCEGAPRIGEPCPDGICERAGFCDADADPPTCSDKRGDGQPCDDPSQCQSGVCDFGAGGECAALATDGDPCDFDADCLSGLCDATEQPAVCASPRPDGQECQDDRQCESTICHDGVCVPPSAVSRVDFDICLG